jgi:hypothetical protein
MDAAATAGPFFGSIHQSLNGLLVVDRLPTGRTPGIDHGIRAFLSAAGALKAWNLATS